ncbi:hypothetical protein L7D48_18655 [Streptomyces sp. S1A]|uniref:hypothetical protein n=1 Tax=Streptomyces sp. ICN903 TaxID=2964654 RepID=UPI001EDB77F7|nr:hypothetical protein [Streptomyces sp. ICN903]MCG3042568.1 hypothetical protein [Streptomyces sp. ICN903]
MTTVTPDEYNQLIAEVAELDPGDLARLALVVAELRRATPGRTDLADLADTVDRRMDQVIMGQ